MRSVRGDLALTRPPTGSGQPVVVGLRALKLGDFCAAVPAWKALRRAHPDHHLVLAAPGWQQPLLALCPAIDTLAPVEPLTRLPGDLAGAALAVNLHGRGPESTSSMIELGADRLLAFSHPRFPDVVGPSWDPDEHEVDRWCRLLRHGGIDADPSQLDLAVPPVGPPVEHGTVVHPGAAHGARRWPAERWATVARGLEASGHRVVVTGGAAERTLGGAVVDRAGLPPGRNLAGRTGLLELAALVAAARLVCCADTGIAHLASAYGTPSVVLFGPVPPWQWGPPATPRHVALWAAPPGWRGDPHSATPDPALLELGPRAVLDAADSALAAADRRRGSDHRGGRALVRGRSAWDERPAPGGSAALRRRGGT